ncbi:DUF4974 domain-containing protein [Pedobacter gandavensis]|uniref:FecR family protein n=1 Tax=Pedobacter gandavensis TaxID=2679963 RepID=UPI00247B2321|nr:FecR domain-containing protein [Pedobacter gandavensis]WGQ12407.1 DUF4974 domain-containing protein [Pedobacter gandavensis]
MKDHIPAEFYRLLKNQCSDKGFESFLNQVNEEQYQGVYGQLIADTLAAEVSPQEIDASLQKRLDQRLALILASNKPKQSRLRPLFKYAIAASILLTVGVAMVFFGRKEFSKSINPLARKIIEAGGQKATLTLSDGSQLFLDHLKNGDLAKESGISIVKTKDGELIYQSLEDPEASQVAASHIPQKYNVLETPKGGQYQIVLPDGTKVWLNAASSLKFPASFAQLENREVELTGEAYFEVAKDKLKPFKVMAIAADGLRETIEVLGTHFNISSYADESKLQTTLLEGSVKIGAKVLTPGQQSVRTKTGLKIKEIDVEEVIAWKNGFFVFENDNLEGILKKLSRWYDVTIVYDGSLNHVKVIGSVARSTDLEQVLRMLEKTDKFKFKLEGRRVFVMP